MRDSCDGVLLQEDFCGFNSTVLCFRCLSDGNAAQQLLLEDRGVLGPALSAGSRRYSHRASRIDDTNYIWCIWLPGDGRFECRTSFTPLCPMLYHLSSRMLGNSAQSGVYVWCFVHCYDRIVCFTPPSFVCHEQSLILYLAYPLNAQLPTSQLANRSTNSTVSLKHAWVKAMFGQWCLVTVILSSFEKKLPPTGR